MSHSAKPSATRRFGSIRTTAPVTNSPAANAPVMSSTANVTSVRSVPTTSAGRSRRVPRKDLAHLTSQLAMMCQSGIDVAAALGSATRQCRNPALKLALQQTHADVINGASLSQALSHSGRLFNETYIAGVAAGEASGRLPSVLASLAELQRSDLKLRTAIRSMLIYPITLVLVSAAVLSGLLLFVLPQFAEVFAQNGMPLPAITQILIDSASFFRSKIWLWGPILLALAGAAAAFRLSAGGRAWCDRFLLRAMFVGEVIQTLCVGRICRLLGLLLESGVPLVESLNLAQKAVNNLEYRKFFRTLEQEVINGSGMREALLGCDYIPASAAEMLVTGEQTGNLAPVARLIGEHFEEEAQQRLRELITVLEPAITVVLGCVVALVVLAVVLPMFDVASFGQSSGPGG